MTGKLAKTVVAGGVVYPAGTPATADLRALIRNPKHWGEEKPAKGAKGAKGASDDVAGYDSKRASDLKSEIARRNEGRDDDARIPATGNKAALIAALIADDERAASGDQLAGSNDES